MSPSGICPFVDYMQYRRATFTDTSVFLLAGHATPKKSQGPSRSLCLQSPSHRTKGETPRSFQRAPQCCAAKLQMPRPRRKDTLTRKELKKQPDQRSTHTKRSVKMFPRSYNIHTTQTAGTNYLNQTPEWDSHELFSVYTNSAADVG